MNADEPAQLLLQADACRESDPEKALRLYAEVPDPSEVARDIRRLRWIALRCQMSPFPSLVPVLQQAIQRCEGIDLRRALHGCALTFYYQKDYEGAEHYWREALTLGRDEHDELTVGCLLNLVLVNATRGRFFETLVLSEQGVRAAEVLGEPFSECYSRVRRADALVHFGDLESANRELDRVEEESEQVRQPKRSRNLRRSVLNVRSRLLRRRRDWQGVRDVCGVLLADLEQDAAQQLPLIASALTERARAQLEIDPRQGPEVIAELERGLDRLQLDEQWRTVREYDVCELWLKHELAKAEPSAAAALELALQLLASVEGRLTHDELILGCSWLGQVLLGLDAAEHAHTAFDLAASRVLQRIVDLERASRELPELSQPSEQDWSLLQSHREQTLEQQKELLGYLSEALSKLWNHDHPAFRMMVGEDSLVSVCAWCRRVRTSEGRWLPLSQFFPKEGDFYGATHGICVDCQHSAGLQ